MKEGVGMAVDYKALKESGFMRQIQKNLFSLRMKVIGGNLPAEQLSVIAEISRKYGKGYVHMTSRQSVEIPFIKLDDIEKVKADLEAGGVNTGLCGPQVRTVTACQGRDVCPSGCIETYPLAVEISERYLNRQLPHKFKIGVTGCMNNCLKAEENDVGIKGCYLFEWLPENCRLCGICIKACKKGALKNNGKKIILNKKKCVNCGRCVKSCPFGAWKWESGYILSFGGIFGNTIAKGKHILPIICDKQILFKVVDKAVDFFDKHAEPGERFRKVIERVGWDEFKAEIEAAYNGS